MKEAAIATAALLVSLLSSPGAGVAQFTPGKSLLPHPAQTGMNVARPASNATESTAFADGTRAINESRWPDAVAIFTRVAEQKGVHADGALYWKAYAENKLGQTRTALNLCVQLRRDFPSSNWLHECGALEIEMRAHSGQPVEPTAIQDESLKLLALNELMKKNEPRALAELQQILEGDSSEKLKMEAQFILNHHYSNATYAQIVRIRFMEGDVRVARGSEFAKTSGAIWEKAAVNLPLETGFSVVTGEGRAEIEFEDASTIYLAENSVLLCNDLHTGSGIPYTQLALLSGTVTLHLQPYVAGEVFVLKTPTGSIAAMYPEKTFLRVSSYTDGFTLAQQQEADARLPEPVGESSAPTPVHSRGRGMVWLSSGNSGAYAEWDKWVEERVAQRSVAIAAMMQASGLNEPIPGMAEMNGQGTFFTCRPYGVCWEPHATAQPSAGEATPPVRDEAEFFPCFSPRLAESQPPPGAMQSPARAADFDYRVQASSLPYTWAVCHDGGWVHMRNHYVWVAGRKRHHLGPGRWIQYGHALALVPLHPWDVKGRPPINRFEEVLALQQTPGLEFKRARLDPAESVKLLNEPPAAYNWAIRPVLARAEEPRMRVYTMKDSHYAGGAVQNGMPFRPAGIPLHFDRKTQIFVMAKHPAQADRNSPHFVALENRAGNLQARAEGYRAGSVWRGRGSGAGSNGGSHH